MKQFFLELNKNQYFEFKSFESVYRLLPLYDARVIFHNNKDQMIVADVCIIDLLESVIHLLGKALKTSAQLHISITDDIGFLWNKELHGEEGLKYEGDFWVGMRNYLWGAPGKVQPNLATWIYNDVNGNIIIEITENYFWHHKDPDQGENYITYEEFMQNYKPYFISIISHELASQWIEQAEVLLKIIKGNEE